MPKLSSYATATDLVNANIPIIQGGGNKIAPIALFNRYLVYTALLSQTAPSVTVFENTIGTIVWTSDGTGNTIGTLAGAFTANKTYLSVSVGQGYDFTAGFYRQDENSVYVEGGSIDPVTTVNLEVYIEIRVYP